MPSGDFSTLSRLVEEWLEAGRTLAPRARSIVEDAIVVFPSDLPPDVASFGSRLEYSASDGKRATSKLTPPLLLFDRDYLPVRHPVGLALLGRREGEDFDVLLDDGTPQRIRLEKALEQPERAWPGRFTGNALLVRQALSSSKRRKKHDARVDGSRPFACSAGFRCESASTELVSSQSTPLVR